jgi:hypothetical protein
MASQSEEKDLIGSILSGTPILLRKIKRRRPIWPQREPEKFCL